MTLFVLLPLIFCMIFAYAGRGEEDSPEYEARIEQFIKGNDFFIDFFVKSLGAQHHRLGNLTFFVNFNPAALTFVGKVDSLDGPWDNGKHPTWYGDITAFKPSDQAICSINTERLSSAPSAGGVAIPDTFTRVARIKFYVTDPYQNRQISWNTLSSSVLEFSMWIDITSLFIFTINETVVPVELATFNGSSVDAVVTLNWSTHSETNNLGFYIYRSEMENGSFKKINEQIIKGSGNSAIECKYVFEDKDVVVGQTYYYKLVDIDFAGSTASHGPISVKVNAPDSYSLDRNYPNPFNPSTKISFKLKDGGYVDLSIYNIKGQIVKKLKSEHMNPGKYLIEWDGKDDSGKILPSGLYFYRIKINDFTQYGKMQFIK